MYKKGDYIKVLDKGSINAGYACLTDGEIYEVLSVDEQGHLETRDDGDFTKCGCPMTILTEEFDYIEKVETISHEEVWKHLNTPEISESVTGSKRVNKGKIDPTHLTPDFILAMAQVLTANEGKYEKYNYAQGQNLSTVNASLMRHLIDVLNGVDVDDTDGCNMYAKIAVNAMIGYCTLKYHLDEHPELDDRFKKVVGL